MTLKRIKELRGDIYTKDAATRAEFHEILDLAEGMIRHRMLAAKRGQKWRKRLNQHRRTK